MKPSLFRPVCLLGLLLPFLPTMSQARYVGACSPSVTLLARGYGSPDDVAVDGKRILFGDLRRNVLAAEQAGRVSTLVASLNVPEGIVVRSKGVVIVAEQGANRLDRINLQTGRRTVILQLRNTTGREGVDGIGRAPGGGLYVPDSPYGTLYLLDNRAHLHLLASELGRPVGAVRFRGGVAVPDETSGAIWFIRGQQVQRLATLSTPDDVAVVHGNLLAVSLGDGRLWRVWPGVQSLASGFSQPQGLAALNSDAVVIADSNRNGLYRVAGLTGCLQVSSSAS